MTVTVRVLFVFSQIIARTILIWPNSNFSGFNTALVTVQDVTTFLTFTLALCWAYYGLYGF